jgi:hypothetical protein
MRGRKPSPERTLATNLHLPESLRTRLDLLLFSELENRVPKGAYMEFFTARLLEFFETQAFDLAPYTGGLPGELTVRGRPAALEALQAKLQGATS